MTLWLITVVLVSTTAAASYVAVQKSVLLMKLARERFGQHYAQVSVRDGSISYSSRSARL